MAEPPNWRDAALGILETADPTRKCGLALRAAAAVFTANTGSHGGRRPPCDPARPSRPVLIDPKDVPRRNLASIEGRIALLHALAHIELNAVDLAFDMAIRFTDEIDADRLDAGVFVADWFAVGRDEARHFGMLVGRLRALGSAYGDLPAHGALWDAARRTASCVLARLCVAPLVLEARGLDVAPAMAGRLRDAGDAESALILDEILEDEIGHVRAGLRWFRSICSARNLVPDTTYAALIREHFPGGLKPPFNYAARRRAGLPDSCTVNWNEACDAQGAPG